MKHLWLVLLLFASGAQANIGKITELQGTAVEIKRGSKSIKASKDSVIESNDTVSVGSSTKLTITFADNSTAKITENSKLIIDDFVYDPKGGAAKSSMKVALGTVRMASGAIAKNSAQNVNIKTPTAAIAVRGTDFAMTVDELGRSTVVLLPSCKDDRDAQRVELSGNCTCGAIDVTTTAGKVSMDGPFLATYAASHQESPLPPVQVDPSVMNAYGEGSLRKPEQVAKAVVERDQKKEEQKDKSRTNEDERKAARDRDDDVARKEREGTSDKTIQRALAGEIGTTKVATAEQTAANPCWPFTSCGNEKGYNWYQHDDPLRGNVIHVRSAELSDNTTYNISVNNVDVSQRVTGNGSSTVTIRQWNR
jgi:hypothetical protein